MFQKETFSSQSRKQIFFTALFAFFLLFSCISIYVYLPSNPLPLNKNFKSNYACFSSQENLFNLLSTRLLTDNPYDLKLSEIYFSRFEVPLSDDEEICSLENNDEIISESTPVTNSSTAISSAFMNFKVESVSFSNTVIDYADQEDKGLSFYRNEKTKAAVEWFYTNITDSTDIAMAILEYADKNNIPLSLAFALAWTESRYNPKAKNTNTNASIDRGLFQLNNKSFPKLTEDDFYDPIVSAKYGMSHLRFCIDTAGNEIAALAMYNAGTNKVRNNNTPKRTLDYVSKIISYQQGIEQLFDLEVVALYRQNKTSYLAMLNTAQ